MKPKNNQCNEYVNYTGNGGTHIGNGGHHPGNGNAFVGRSSSGYAGNNGRYIAAYRASRGIYRDSTVSYRDSNGVLGNSSYELPNFINSESESVSIGRSTDEAFTGFRAPIGHYISILADPTRTSVMTEKEPDPAIITTTTVTSKTTTTKTTSGSSVSVFFDRSFAKSPQGVLAAIEAFYSLIAFIVVAATDRRVNSGSFAFFMTVTFVVFFFTLCYYIGEITHLRYKIPLPWTELDMAIYITYILVLLLSSSLVASRGYTPSHGAGASLGFVVMQLYILSLVLTIMQFRAKRSMNQQSTGAMGADNTANTIGEGAAQDSFYGGPGPGY